MRHAVLLSSPDPRCFFLLFLILRMASRSRVPEVVFLTFSFFHFALFYFFYLFYSFIIKIKVPLFISIRSAIRNTRFESGRRASYISRIRCKSCPFIFVCESRRCIGCTDSESPFPLYLVLLSSSLLFYFVIPLSLF